LALVCALASAQAASAGKTVSTTAKKTSTHTTTHKSKSKKKTTASRRRGQKKIDGDRAREIQEALIRENYLTGKATGVWDDTSQKAIERYQADNGWQSKTVPDSRALIKLGLGPDHEHLLNPESAMTTAPAPAVNKDASRHDDPPQN
jgi:hypothetical protein